jgi:hypothetical protein
MGSTRVYFLATFETFVRSATNLMKRQIQTNEATFFLSSWIIFDFKIKISGKNCVEKHPHIIVFMFGSKTNEFGRVWTSLDGKNRNLKKRPIKKGHQ